MNKTNFFRAIFVLCLVFLSNIKQLYPQEQVKLHHYVPTDKNLSKEWMDAIYAKGERTIYRGDELKTIGMPCGGIGAGQLYVRGDGTLARWWIFSDYYETTFYKHIPFTNYKTYRPKSEVKQGFMISAKTKGNDAVVLPLSRDGFKDVGFIGEYPVATILYKQPNKTLPVDVKLEVYSPFIPLDIKNSALPATIFSYDVTNTSEEKVDVNIGGWLQNSAIPKADSSVYAIRENRIKKNSRLVASYLTLAHPEGAKSVKTSYRIIDDFEADIIRDDGTSAEKGSLIKWKINGDAFGNKATNIVDIKKLGSRDFMYYFKGSQGNYLLFSGIHGRDKTGKVSRDIILDDDYISFLIAGRKSPYANKNGAICVNLIVDGKVVRTATGENNWLMRQVSWNVTEYKGKKGTIEIVDSSEVGSIAVDLITFSNFVMEKGKMFPENDKSFGDMSIAVLDKKGKASAKWENEAAFETELSSQKKGIKRYSASITDSICGSVSKSFTLNPRESKTVTFVISWYFPNLKNDSPGCPGDVGRMYSNWFDNSIDVSNYIADNFEMLSTATHKYRDAMYLESTLPYWFLQRTAASSANMASAALEWWRNGRMYSYEGVGFCFGTCGHVWNYVQTPSHLFPKLERSVRKMQDFNFNVSQRETGRINFRGYKDNSESFDNWGYIPDAQAGYILKAYREHLMSADNVFLNQLWPHIKLGMEYLMERDARYGKLDGILDGLQHFTDNLGWGPNTFSGSLYLAALRACEEMSKIEGDSLFVQKCHSLYESGREWTVKNLWNGEYFIHHYTPAPKGGLPSKKGNINKGKSFGNGCLSDQVFGQNWAQQLGLGYIYPKSKVDSTLLSVYKYNWTPRMETIYKVMTRRFIYLADPDKPGMVGLTYPLGIPPVNRPSQNDDPWTGYEYQVSSHLLREGFLTEGLSIAYGVHQRYNPEFHNPWNEIEGGDHYTRSMAAWGMLLGISGYEYDGPAGKIGFAPKITPENFKCFFSSAEGWGSFSQKRTEIQQINSLDLKYGKLKLNELKFEVPEGKQVSKLTLRLGSDAVEFSFIQNGNSVIITTSKLVINESEILRCEIQL